MNLTPLIDVAIGLSLIYLAASLYVTIVNEFLAQALRLRSKQLMADLETLIDSPALKTALQAVPALKPFFKATPDRTTPSYLDPKVFAQMLVGAIQTAPQTAAAQTAPQAAATLDGLVKAINSLPDSNLKKQLSALAQSTQGKVDDVVDNVARWVDQSLTMMGEIYKRRMQLISFAIGAVVAVVLNLNTVAITSRLYADKDVRDALVARAELYVDDAHRDPLLACINLTQEERSKDPKCTPLSGLIEDLSKRSDTFAKLPIGWSDLEVFWAKVNPTNDFYAWLVQLVGWGLTALAISLGAPFWFDLLNRLVNIRHAMRRPETPAGNG